MADVFLSYASEDRKLALELANRLADAGISVWWDRYIHGGADFATEIEREIKTAKSVVVLWSRVSQSSQWVRDEAAYARDENKLVPLQIDGTPPPFGFRQVQTIDFLGWNGTADAEPFAALIKSLSHLLDPAQATEASAARPPMATKRTPFSQLRSVIQRRRGALALVAGVIACGLVAVMYLKPPRPSLIPETASGDIEIRPFAANPPDAERIARAATYADAFRNRFSAMGVRNTTTAQDANARKPELVLIGKIARDGDKEILTSRIDDRRTGATLWSIRDELSEGAAWEANVTSYAVKCALKRRDPAAGLEMFSRYLHGCASYLDGDFSSFHAAAKAAYDAAPNDPRAIAFHAVGTVAAGYGVAVSKAERERYMSAARRLAERALKLDPKNADAMVAMGFTYSDPQFSEQEHWWRAASEADSDSGIGVGRYGDLLASVGRIRESMDMELRAAHDRPNKRIARAAALFASEGNWRQAEALYDRARPFDPDYVASNELRTNVMYGDIGTASRMLAEHPEMAGRDLACWTRLLSARRKEKYDAAQFAEACGGRFDSAIFYTLAGDLHGAYREMEAFLKLDDAFETPHLFGSSMSSFYRDQRFWPLAARMGLAAYWLKSGHWPDFCAERDHPVNCEEAARTSLAALATTGPGQAGGDVRTK